MRFSTSGIRVMRNFPGDAEVASHRWLVRAGYIFQHGSGIYSFAPLFYRVDVRPAGHPAPDRGIIRFIHTGEIVHESRFAFP